MSRKEMISPIEAQEQSHFFRQAFLAHEPGRFAVMMPENSSRKYVDYTGAVTDELLGRHLKGDVTLAVPAAWNGLASYLPLDVDRGGLQCLRALMEEAEKRKLWSFGQYSPRPGWRDEEQRGYVWLVVDQLTSAARLQQLGHEIVGAVEHDGRKIEARAHGADTRLPLGKHTHTLSFGSLLLPGNRELDIDLAPHQTFQVLRQQWNGNYIDSLPLIVAPGTRSPYRRQQSLPSVEQYNREHDIEDLLYSYGARRAGRSIFHCPFHHDIHASLIVYTDRQGLKVCRCLSTQSKCPLSIHGRYDAFNVFTLACVKR